MAVRPGVTAGADFIDMKPPKNCKKCTGEILVAYVRHKDGSYRWHNFARKPIEVDGQRYYIRHACPR